MTKHHNAGKLTYRVPFLAGAAVGFATCLAAADARYARWPLGCGGRSRLVAVEVVAPLLQDVVGGAEVEASARFPAKEDKRSITNPEIAPNSSCPVQNE